MLRRGGNLSTVASRGHTSLRSRLWAPSAPGEWGVQPHSSSGIAPVRPPCHVSRPSRRVCAQAALRGRKEAGPGPRAGALPRYAPEQRVFQDDRHERCHGMHFSGSFSGLCCRNPRTAKRCAPSTRVDVQFPPSKDACPAFTDKRRIPPQDYPLPWKGSTASPASTLPALPL